MFARFGTDSRKLLVRLASVLDRGSEERRVILSGLVRGSVHGRHAMLDGFEFFDDIGPEPEKTPESIAIEAFERKMGISQVQELSPAMMRDRKVIEMASNQFRYIQPHRAWFLYADIPSSQATRFGIRAFRGLVGRRNLHSSIPALHQVPLWVGTQDGKLTQVDPPKPRS